MTLLIVVNVWLFTAAFKHVSWETRWPPVWLHREKLLLVWMLKSRWSVALNDATVMKKRSSVWSGVCQDSYWRGGEGSSWWGTRTQQGPESSPGPLFLHWNTPERLCLLSPAAFNPLGPHSFMFISPSGLKRVSPFSIVFDVLVFSLVFTFPLIDHQVVVDLLLTDQMVKWTIRPMKASTCHHVTTVFSMRTVTCHSTVLCVTDFWTLEGDHEEKQHSSICWSWWTIFNL